MSDLQTALWITAWGMGLVFGAIIVLWLMMILLTALTADTSSPLSARSASRKGTMSDAAEADSTSRNDILVQAAAIGVAMAMAEQRLSSAHPLSEPPTAIVSAWQLGMRTRQMTQKGGRHK